MKQPIYSTDLFFKHDSCHQLPFLFCCDIRGDIFYSFTNATKCSNRCSSAKSNISIGTILNSFNENNKMSNDFNIFENKNANCESVHRL